MDAVLERDPWFLSLPAAARAALGPLLQMRSVADGEALFRRGDSSNGWFGVLEGAVQVSGVAADGKLVALALLGPGEWVGEVSALDGHARTHDVLAHGPTRVAWLPQADFDGWSRAHEGVRECFLQLVCSRLRYTYGLVEDVQTLAKPALIARRLLVLADSFGQQEAAGSTALKVRLSQEDIATLLGLSRQRVNQELTRLAQLGIAEAAYGDVRIHDLEALRREAQG